MLFKVILRPDKEDGGFNMNSPALPGCHSQGDTEREAVENIKDAMKRCVEVLDERARKREAYEKILEVAIG